MFEKLKLKKKIEKLKKEIEDIEQKRIRSQSKLVEAILTNSSPSDADVDYFNKYTAEIDTKRDELQELQVTLSKMK